MKVRIVFIVALFLPFRVVAWEDDAVLSFISQVNPIILAQRNVTQAYAQPDSVTWALQNTSLSGRLGFGGTDFRDDPYTVFGGLQINIPLSSIKEEREQALKVVAEAKALDDMHTKALLDIAQLRQMEAELEASQVRRTFLKEKAAWLKQRIDEGYSSEMNELWTIGSKLNTEDALIAKVGLLAKTQRYKLAKYAGTEWPTLLAYLEGKTETLGGYDG
ncbi:hypothetical protein GO003_025770 [Methylicorpusculum oleiharenae]|uniref:hypothetical protein n=1 Tax=Methylicorpusculum oleiharenae TaxID=1338687 RepID=UPI00135AF41B|nr:hypothetical protein [Methylicorpusculum oleiharenae]MCD2453787.1 hypothetical protein [Methylicorpusculum oleiharenae]